MRVLGQEHDVDFTLQREIEERRTPGPRLVCAGVQLAKPGGHGHASTAVATEEDIERVAAVNLSKGAAVLKIFATGGVSSEGTSADAAPFTEREIRRAADVAHRHGVLLAAHAHGGEGARRAIAGGVDTIEHGGALDDDLIGQVVERNLAVVGTFAILYHADGIERGDAGSASIMAKVASARQTVERTWRRLLHVGVRHALGTDSMHGLMAFELEKLVSFGASPADALRAATATGAGICGVGSTRGRLAPGYDADVVAVRGNALRDITCVGHPVLVMQQGRVVFRT
jgi:imidazolonepropionase-like amidohydrolase